MDILLWMGVLAGVLLVAAIVWVVLRRWLMSGDGPGGGRAFTIEDLRDMHRRGLLTQEEFDRAKAAVAAREVESLLRKGDRAKGDSGVRSP